MASLQRPLSPYLQYVNVQTLHTMGFSILHRITGVALSVGIVPLVYWLSAAAQGPEAYAKAQALFASAWMQVLVVGWAFSFCYHLLNGIRHLVWDTGHGLERPQARASGWLVFVGALLLTLLVVAVAWSRLNIAGAP